MSAAPPSFDAKAFLKRCSRKPGVYRMYDADDKVLYVGKARDLRSRLDSYFQKQVASLKTAALVSRIARVETTIKSEEHTSELQSLMRISYAVFCLKKQPKQ